MKSVLPEKFSDDMNELVTALRHYDLSTNETEKNELLKTALGAACRFLNSIDLNTLSHRIEEIFRDAEVYERTEIKNKTWFNAMLGKATLFNQFIDETEDEILKRAGVQTDNRKRLLRKLRDLRKLAQATAGSLTTTPIINGITSLKNEVCRLKDAPVQATRHLAARNKALAAALAGVIVADAEAPALFPAATPADRAASVALGAVAQLRA